MAQQTKSRDDTGGDHSPMSLDGNGGTDVGNTGAELAKDNDGVPYCRVHHCRMTQKSGGSADKPQYYKCKVPKCPETAKLISTPDERVVPQSPQACPRCSKGSDTKWCERDDRSSTAASVVLKCPACGWKSTPMAVPQLAAAHLARRLRPPVEPLGEVGAR